MGLTIPVMSKMEEKKQRIISGFCFHSQNTAHNAEILTFRLEKKELNESKWLVL